MSTATITAHSRNLGISWSNEPERIWNADCSSSWLSIRTPEPPKACNLGIAGVLREAADIARKHSGNEYSLALWMTEFLPIVDGGRRACGTDGRGVK